MRGLEYEKAERQEELRRVEGKRKRRYEGGEAFYAERVQVGAFSGEAVDSRLYGEAMLYLQFNVRFATHAPVAE